MTAPALCGVMCIARIHTPRQLLEAVRHNKRERLQPHIDPERVSLNYALAGPTVGQNVSQTITHTARAMLRAAGLGNGPNLKPLRKNVVYGVEIIFSLPPGFRAENIRAYFQDCLAWMGRHFCDVNNILSADVHLDESAPHMHVLVLPLVQGRMQGGKMCGSPAQFSKWRESLYTEVGVRFGLSRPAQQLRGKAKEQAITMVLTHYQRSFPDLLNDPAWPVMRKAIERDPLPYVQRLGLEVAPHQKKMRTMAQIFTSKGKGPNREPRHAHRVTASAKTLCSVAIDKSEHERVDEAPISKVGDAVGAMAQKPKARTKKTDTRGGMTLTQDCADYSETSSDSGKDTKAPFLQETRNYLDAVADALRAFGYEPNIDSKVCPEKPVSVNKGSMASSGDVTLTMRHPETGNNACITIRDTTLRGIAPSTCSGIAVMHRVGSANRYATKAGNTWTLAVVVSNIFCSIAEFMRQSRGLHAALLVGEKCNLPIDFEKNLGADMGGVGSGRRLDSTRRKTSQVQVLDVRVLRRKGLLQPGYRVQWTGYAADGTARVTYADIHPDKIVVSRFWLIETDRSVFRRNDIALEWTACHLGGKRPWFRCPIPGCGRRVACLYLASSGAYSCRRCQRLVYEVQYEKPAFRLMTKGDKIRCKLGWGPGIANPPGDKPKGMHWHTFWRLAILHDRIALGAFGLMQAQLREET